MKTRGLIWENNVGLLAHMSAGQQNSGGGRGGMGRMESGGNEDGGECKNGTHYGAGEGMGFRRRSGFTGVVVGRGGRWGGR